ncbi:MAG TPA: glycosyltransferase family 2 protein [Patescibacteria group bacterium]|nr:glycosyltransferase family 2 protein [Patescibacteria group bacterium]
MPPLVTVVVPAHNPGRYIEPCIRSILRQTLPRDRFEAVFVDDGSTDGTTERLKRLAQEQPHVRSIRIPASGAPGRPRNIGLEAARGTYVQFLDADDELAPRALERLLRMARANRSDIVLGKFASETMSRRQDLFARNRPATTFAATPGLADGSLGPTKLFRAALLREREIAFPEGWRQMEDQLFTLRAYLAARVISVLGDEPCYFFNKREDEGHISGELVEPATHVAHLGEILDEIDDRAVDAELRRRLHARFYRTEILARLAGPQFLAAPADYRAALFASLRELAAERLGDELAEGLGALARIRSRLLLDGDLDGIVELARRADAFSVDATIERASWVNGRLGIELRAQLSRGDAGGPLTLRERDGRTLLDASIAEDLVGPADVTDELAAIRLQASVVDRDTALEWIVPGGGALSMQARANPAASGGGAARPALLVGLVELDPQRVGPGERRLDDGSWSVLIRWSGLGFTTSGSLRFARRGEGSGSQPIPPALVGKPLRWVVARADSERTLHLAIGGADRLPARIDQAGRGLVRDGASVAIALPVATDRIGPLGPGHLRLVNEEGTYLLPASLDGALGGLTLSVADVRAAGPIRPGRYELTAHLGDQGGPGLAVGAVHVRPDGRFAVVGMRRVPVLARVRAWAEWAVRASWRAGRTRALATYRRLPQSTKDAIRARYGSTRS